MRGFQEFWIWDSVMMRTVRLKLQIALAEAFECEVNELPLSMIPSWYEQKAVAILLTLGAWNQKYLPGSDASGVCVTECSKLPGTRVSDYPRSVQ